MEFPTLGQFNPSSIKGFDAKSLQQLKAKDIKALVMEKKFECASGAIILGAIIAVSVIVSSASATGQDLDSQIAALVAKADPIYAYKKAVKEQDEVTAAVLPALANEEFILALTKVASNRNIRITDYTPPTVAEGAYFKKYTSRFSCVAPDFVKAITFIHSLETGKHSMRLEQLILRPLAASKGFDMSLVVSSTEIQADKAKAKE